MCYIHGSVEQAISVCPMCKVFRPSGARCPHVKETCRNRQLHPMHDVVYLKNAEVSTFKGCGYCKWARANSGPKATGYQNPGWPGCCRQPSVGENRLIPPADWLAVSTVHHITIPVEIKNMIESAKRDMVLAPPAIIGRSVSQSSPKGAVAVLTTTPPKATIALAKTPPVAIPNKGRSGGSPKQTASSFSRDSRGTGATSMPSPVSPSAELRRSHSQKREVSPGSLALPSRRSLDPDGTMTIGRRIGMQKKPPTASASALAVSLSRTGVEDVRPPLKRQISAGGEIISSSPPDTRFVDVKNTPTVPSRAPRKGASMENMKVKPPKLVTASAAKPAQGPSSADSSGSGSTGGLSESTVTSEGFTDYLSDESEAELQKQAELKAAMLAQNKMEEQEFKAARKQLAHVDLRPPNSWSASISRPRPAPSHVAAYTQNAGYPAVFMPQQARAQIDVGGFARAK